MLDNGALLDVVKMLDEDHSSYADLLTSCINRQQKKSAHVVGVLGDDLVGKSSVINAILGHEILPTTVIPSAAEITIRYGVNSKVVDESGVEVEKYDLTQLSEESVGFTLETNNEYLRNNNLVFKEFHGLLSKQKINDMSLMADVYKCDAIVVVMSAEHLLSESECIFIDNYIKYAGATRLLLVINKLSCVEKSDIGRVLEYASSQINSKFKNVKWTVNNTLNERSSVFEKYTTKTPGEIIPSLFEGNESETNETIRNVLKHISGQLQKNVEDLKRAKVVSLEEIEKERNTKKQQKEYAQTSVEMSLIELKRRSNLTEESIDEHLRGMFENIASELLQQYEKAPTKVAWYENELDRRWREAVSAVSGETDRLISEKIESDIEWLNGIFETKLGVNTVPIKVGDDEISSVKKMVPYSNYKRFAAIGIGGGVVIGYCLFRIVGAVVGLGGGLLAYTYVGLKESEQNEEIKRIISTRIKDISLETRKVTKNEIEKLYMEILDEYKGEASKIIDAKYSFSDQPKSNYDMNIEKYEKIISRIKEV